VIYARLLMSEFLWRDSDTESSVDIADATAVGATLTLASGLAMGLGF
jgi:hypothetical protein